MTNKRELQGKDKEDLTKNALNTVGLIKRDQPSWDQEQLKRELEEEKMKKLPL